MKKGFRGNGFYLNPNCHLDYCNKANKTSSELGHFNSLFLCRCNGNGA
ncbi:glycoside hydrolase [Vibrio chagasii]|nr:glycoside hydrolase [Vibrio chagasii]